MAIVCESENGRRYVSPSVNDLIEVEHQKPDLGAIPKNHRDFKTPNYGMLNWEDLFTQRQSLAMSTFSDVLVDLRTKIEIDQQTLPVDGVRLRDGGVGRTAYADALITYLAFAIDKCSYYWSSICTWHASR